MTQDSAKVGWAVVREKFHAGLLVAKEQAHAQCVAAKERVGTLLTGKALLDQGGPAAEQAICAKVVARDAAEQDSHLAEHLASAAKALDAAAAKLHSCDAPSEALPEGIRGVQEFENLAKAYETRSQAYKQLLEGLRALPPAPALSAAEQDAASIVRLKHNLWEGYRVAATRAMEGCEAVKERRGECLA